MNITCDIGIAIDSDMVIVDDKVKDIVNITKKFGLCFPNCPRIISEKELNAIDGGENIYPETYNISALNVTPLTFNKTYMRGRKLLKYIINRFEKYPSRLSACVINSMWETGIYPYILPFNWCVCSNNMELPGVKDKYIVLHVGDKIVFNYWKEHY